MELTLTIATALTLNLLRDRAAAGPNGKPLTPPRCKPLDGNVPDGSEGRRNPERPALYERRLREAQPMAWRGES